MQIEPKVYLVGSGQAGFDLTDRYDCNIYLFDAGDEYVLFDAGTGMGAAQILAICKQDGILVERIRHLFLTHAHGDHGGGAAHLQQHMPVAVYAAAATARIVTSGDEHAVSLPVAKRGGVYPDDYEYRSCPVEKVVSPGEVLTFGVLQVEAIATPGHSHDHTSYLVSTPAKRYLVGGDAIFYGGKVVWQHTYDCSVPETNASLLRLATYEFDALLPGHLNFSLKNGKRHIETACELIARMGCPQSL